MVAALFKSYGARHPGLNEQGFAGGMFGTAELFFSYESGALDCLALIYRFRRKPQPRVLELLETAAQETETGAGSLKYQTENQSLFLKREYIEAVSEEQFVDDMKRLADASVSWSSHVLERVASKTFDGN